jgi:hypothetical protein
MGHHVDPSILIHLLVLFIVWHSPFHIYLIGSSNASGTVGTKKLTKEER